jgi:hypothetical protein
VLARQTHITNLKTSISTTRTADMELKAKMTEAKTSLEKKTRDINNMTKQ